MGSSSIPHVLSRRSNVSTVGDPRLRSMREMDGWGIPDRRASSRWESPARRRAMFRIRAAFMEPMIANELSRAGLRSRPQQAGDDVFHDLRRSAADGAEPGVAPRSLDGE